MILWLKAFHIVFVVTWFAGLFYLPRLFVYHAAAEDDVSVRRFCVMERRLFVLMTLGAILAAGFGAAMVAAAPVYLQLEWLRLKLMFVAALVVYHYWCYRLVSAFRVVSPGRTKPPHSSRWFRWFNEIPSILLIVIVVLAVVKP